MIEMEGTLLVKRLVVLPGCRVRVSSDNLAYESFVLDPQLEEFRVIGKVVGSLRAFRSVRGADYLRTLDGRRILVPENPDYLPMMGESIQIAAVVTSTMRIHC